MKIHRHQYSAGSRSWRTNNPGLLPANEITWPYGAIGEALGVAVFRDPDAGRKALRGYLAHDNNAGRTVDDRKRQRISVLDCFLTSCSMAAMLQVFREYRQRQYA